MHPTPANKHLRVLESSPPAAVAQILPVGSSIVKEVRGADGSLEIHTTEKPHPYIEHTKIVKIATNTTQTMFQGFVLALEAFLVVLGTFVICWKF